MLWRKAPGSFLTSSRHKSKPIFPSPFLLNPAVIPNRQALSKCAFWHSSFLESIGLCIPSMEMTSPPILSMISSCPEYHSLNPWNLWINRQRVRKCQHSCLTKWYDLISIWSHQALSSATLLLIAIRFKYCFSTRSSFPGEIHSKIYQYITAPKRLILKWDDMVHTVILNCHLIISHSIYQLLTPAPGDCRHPLLMWSLLSPKSLVASHRMVEWPWRQQSWLYAENHNLRTEAKVRCMQRLHFNFSKEDSSTKLPDWNSFADMTSLVLVFGLIRKWLTVQKSIVQVFMETTYLAFSIHQ